MKIKCTTSFYHQNDYNENDEKYQILAIVWSNTRFSLLDKYPKEICVHLPQERYIRMFIAELFGVSLNLKGSRCPSRVELIKKLCYHHTVNSMW